MVNKCDLYLRVTDNSESWVIRISKDKYDTIETATPEVLVVRKVTAMEEVYKGELKEHKFNRPKDVYITSGKNPKLIYSKDSILEGNSDEKL